MRVTIDGPSPLDGHLAVPADTTGGPVPGVVVLHEAFGRTPDVVAAADRLAGRGYLALLAAARGYDAAAPNHGQLPRDPAEVLRGACPIVAKYGERDVALRGAAGRLSATLTGLGVPHDVKEYPEAGHSFMNHHTGWLAQLERVPGVGYRGDDAADAWRRIDAFFDEHLRAG